MSIFKVLDDSISDTCKNFIHLLGDMSPDIRRGAEFMLFSLSTIFPDKEIDDIEQGIVDSSYRKETHDYGIDALYITASNDFVEAVEDLSDYNEDTKFNIHIFQFKRGTGITQADLLKFRRGISKVFIEGNILEDDNLYLHDRVQTLSAIKTKLFTDFPSENIFVNCHVVFGGIEAKILAENILTEELSELKKDLESGGYINSSVRITDCQALIKGPNKNQNLVDIIEYEKNFKYITDTDKSSKLNGYISIVKGSEIAELVRKHQSSIFEANIRDYFKRNDLNSKIVETSSNTEEAKYFWSFNNGLTVTCSKVEELPGSKYKLHNLQIVNGCQTSNAIYSAMKNKERCDQLIIKRDQGAILTQKEQEELNKKSSLQFNPDTSLLVKIIETSSEDLIYRITETTNSQTPIKAFSLKANDDVQKMIEKFLEKYDIAYERRINELRNKGRRNIYSLQRLFQLYSAIIRLKPSQAKTIPKKMFLTTYDDVFPAPNVKSINFELYYIPILIDIKVNEAVKLFSPVFEKDSYRKALLIYGKYHLGCFLLSSILKKEYSEKGIINNEIRIKDELNQNLTGHFLDAVENLERMLKSIAGTKKESVASALRKTELDNRIARFVKNRK